MKLDNQPYKRWLLQLQAWATDGRLVSAGVDALRLKRIDEQHQTLAAEA